MTGLAKLMDPIIGYMARWYQNQVGKELRKYGLRYEDLLDPVMDLVSYTVLLKHLEQLADTPPPGCF